MSKKLNHSLAIGIFLIGLLSANLSQAQTATGATWDNTGSEWTSGASWVGDNAPTNSSSTVGNVATFSNAAVGFNTVNLGTAQSIYGLLFTAGANAYTFTGSNLTMNGTYGITNLSSTVQTFNNKIVNAESSGRVGSVTAGGSLVFAGGIDLSATSANRTVTMGGIGNITVSGAIANGGSATTAGVTITNQGLTIFSGNNTYGGTTTVQSGATLRLGRATALGTTNGGTAVTGALDLNGQTIDQEALSISGTGVSSSGSLFNSSSSAASWSGNIVQTATSTIKATNGSIGISGGINLNGDGATSRTLNLDGTGGIVLSGNISNSFAGSTGNIAIAANARNVTLSGNNSYNGTTTLDGGGMNINSANAISTNTFVINGDSFLNNTSGGAITNLGNNNITLGDRFTFGTSSSTAANSLNLGTGTVTATGGRLITIAGSGVTLGLGTLDSTSAASGGRTHIANGEGNTLSLAGWKIQSGSSSNVVATLAGSANWTIGGPIVNGNAFSNGVQIDATGLTTFGGNNTYDGTTIVSSNATLRITSATGLGSTNTGTTVSTGGQLQLSGGITVSAGEALSLSGGAGSLATLRNISGANTYNGAITFTSGTNRINSDAGTLTLSSVAGTLASTRSLIVGGDGDTTFTGRFTGTGIGTLTKDGAGTLTLANTNFDIGGGVFVNSGKLALAANNALGATRAVGINGGTLDITTFDNTVGAVSLTNGTIAGTTGVLTGTSYAVESGTISARLGGGGALTKSGSGAATLSGSNSYSGLTAVNGGTLTLSGNNSAASGGVTLTAGTLNVNSTNALGSGTLTLTTGTINNTSGAAVMNSGNNAVTLGNGLTYGTEGGTASNDLDLGTGTVTVSSDRTLTLLGTGTTLKMGTLESTASSGGKDFTFSGAGNTMFFRGFNISTGTSAAVNNNLVGSANLTISGPIANGNAFANGVNVKGTGTTTFSGENTYTGGTEIFSGSTLLYGANNVTADAAGQMTVSGTLNIASYNDTVSLVRVNAGGLLSGTTGTLSAGSFGLYGDNTVSAKLGGSAATLVKGTTNSVSILSGNNTYGGLTTVNGGTLKLGSSTALGSTNGATTVGTSGFLDLNGQTGVAEALNYTGTGGLLNSAAGAATVSGAVDIGAGMTVNTTGDITLSGQLTGISSRNLTKSGAGTLKFTAANSTFSGTNTVSAGTLLVDTGANVASSTSIVNGGLLKVNGTVGAVTVNIGGSLGGSGTVGAVTLKNGSSLNPGNSPGLLTASLATWEAGSTYNWEIDNADGIAGTNWDLFSVTGALDLSALSSSAKMNLVLASLSTVTNFSATTPDSWVFAQAGSLVGTAFTAGSDVTDLFNINATAFNAGVGPANGWRIEVGDTGKTLNLMAIPEPSTGSMLGLGFAGLVVTRLLRRKIS